MYNWNTLFGQDVKGILNTYLKCRAEIQSTDIVDWIFMNALEKSLIYISHDGFIKVNWPEGDEIADINSYKELSGFLSFETMLPANTDHNMIVKSIRFDFYDMLETGAGREDFEQVLGVNAAKLINYLKGDKK